VTIEYEDMTPTLAKAGLITAEVAAEMLGCSVKYLRIKVSRFVRPVKVGSAVFWRTAAIEAYRDNHPRLGNNRRAA
jgi:hypothetical protein